jgi:hypothetical protein
MLLGSGVSSCTQLKKINGARLCIEDRAAIKITPKQIVYMEAKVDSCNEKLIQTHEKSTNQVNIFSLLKDKYSSANYQLPASLIKRLKVRINHAKAKGMELKIAASSDFQKDQYTRLIPQYIERVLQKEVTLLSDEDEAISYYLAYKASMPPDGVLGAIWFLDKDKNILVAKNGRSQQSYHSFFAASSLREKVIEWKGSSGPSPYPIGAYHAKKAIEFASDHANENVPDNIKELLRTQQINGISSLHGLIENHTGSKTTPYSRYDLELIAKKRMTRSLNYEYGDNDVVGLFLILGYMRALDIKTILFYPVDIDSSILFSPSLWKSGLSKFL